MSSLIIEVLSGSSQGLAVPLTRQIVIGSDPQGGLVLRDAGIDRRHAEIAIQKGQLWIRDLGSVAGTYLGSQRLGQQFVSFPPGGAVRCAGVRFRVRAASPAPAAPGSARVRGPLPGTPASGRVAGNQAASSRQQHFPKLQGPGRGPTPSRPYPRPQRAPAPNSARVPPAPAADTQGLLVNAVIDLASQQCLGLKAHTPELEGIDRGAFAATAIGLHAQLSSLEATLAEPGQAGQFRVESAQATFFLRRFEDDAALFVLLAARGFPAEAGWQNLAEAYARFSKLSIKRPEPSVSEAKPKLSATGFINLLALEKQDPSLLVGPGGAVQPAPSVSPSSGRPASARLGLGARLMGARNGAGLTVRAAATRLGVDRKEWTLWERGARVIPERYKQAIVQIIPGAAEFL